MLGRNDGCNDGDTEGAWHDGNIKIAEKLLFDASRTRTFIVATEASSLTDMLPLQVFVPDPDGANVIRGPTAESKVLNVKVVVGLDVLSHVPE